MLAADGSHVDKVDAPGLFAALLERHRVNSGLSQEELAERAGLSRRGISDLERGQRRSPYPATVRQLAQALGLAGEDLATFVAAARRVHPGGPTITPAGTGPLAKNQPANTLPIHLTTFSGREQEVSEAKRLLAVTRLVTLTGPGGIGKTRLAIEIARAVHGQFDDGVHVVELASVDDARLVPQAVASAVGVREQSGQALIASLTDALRDRRLLLILDNCEHLVHACAELADSVLRCCPECRVLATSREVLSIAGETALRVPPLSLPRPGGPIPIEDAFNSEAVRLFVERARAGAHDFTLTKANALAVAQVCQRLEGIPLALELAAARVRLLSVDQIAARLDDHFGLLSNGSRTSPVRQQTIRATVDWSYALLSAPERMVLEQLAVFAGGWTLEAAEAVCLTGATHANKAGHASTTMLDLLGRLLDKSLIMTQPTGDEVRYRLLETVRQYAAERLRASGDETGPSRRHAMFFLHLLEQAEGGLMGSDQAVWLDRMEQEHDNLRATLRWSLHSGELDIGLRLAWVLWRFWWVRGYLAEGRQHLAELLGLARVTGASRVLARGFVSAGLLALWQGDYAAASQHLEQGLALARRV